MKNMVVHLCEEFHGFAAVAPQHRIVEDKHGDPALAGKLPQGSSYPNGQEQQELLPIKQEELPPITIDKQTSELYNINDISNIISISRGVFAMPNSNLPNSISPNSFPANDILSVATSLLNNGNFDKLIIDKKRGSIQITSKDESGCVNTISQSTTPAANRLALTKLNTNDKKTRNDEIIRMHNQGYTQTVIASETGLSQSGVHNILKKAGAI